MSALVCGFLEHQAWADAEHWRAIGSYEPARNDQAIHARLHHIAIVQRAFLWNMGERQEPFTFSKPEDFTFEALRSYARGHHDRFAAYLTAVTDARLAESLDIPWFKDPPLTLSVEEALAQCSMHSHYHRGQNATRLRELGGEPPMTDLIVWYWKGRPRPDWGADV